MSKYDPWDTDAAVATKRNGEFIDQLPMLGHGDAATFLGKDLKDNSEWEDAPSIIVVANRGFGKSHILATRSRDHREATKRNKTTTLFHPRRVGKNTEIGMSFVDCLDGQHVISAHHLRAVDAAAEWTNIWIIAIIGMWTWRLFSTPTERKNLDEFEAVFSNLTDLDDTAPAVTDDQTQIDADTPPAPSPMTRIIRQILDSTPAERDDCVEYLSRIARNASDGWAHKITAEIKRRNTKKLACYLDNPDEMFKRTADNDQLWRNAQIGLLLAVRRLDRSGTLPALQIYATIRGEALASTNDPDASKAKGLTITLDYDPATLKAIFVHRIRKTYEIEQEDVSNFSDSELISKFCGQHAYTHPDRIDAFGNQVDEPIFDSILRHTRRVPRELISIGSAIRTMHQANKESNLQKNRGHISMKVRIEVNSVAKKNIADLTRDTVLTWTKYHNQFAMALPSEVICGDVVRKLIESIDTGKRYRIEIFNYFINQGLIGYAEAAPQVHSSYYLQQFFTGTTKEEATTDLHTKDWYFVHPAFKEWLKTLPDAQFNQSSNKVSQKTYVVGHLMRYEAKHPKIRVLRSGEGGVLVFSKDGEAAITIKCDTNPFRYLFVCLSAWKATNGKPFSREILASTRDELTKARSNYSTMNLPSIDRSGADDGEANLYKIQMENMQKALGRSTSAVKAGWPIPNEKVLSIKKLLISFPQLLAADIMIDECELG